jgi:hypothetical protein
MILNPQPIDRKLAGFANGLNDRRNFCQHPLTITP